MTLPIAETADNVLSYVQACVPRGAIPTGRIMWTNYTNGVDVSSYGSFSMPFKTLEYAVTQAVDGRGDIIVVSSQTETALTADVDITASELTIIGTGNSQRPAYDHTAAYNFIVNADGVHLHNLHFRSGATGALGLRVQANRCSVTDCLWTNPNAGRDFSAACIQIGTDGASGLTDILIANNRFCPHPQTTPREAVIYTYAETITNLCVVRNVMNAQISVAVIYVLGALENCHIVGNFFYSGQNAKKFLELHDVTGTTITGVIANNRGFQADSINGIANSIDAQGFAMVENYVANVHGESGGLVGTAST